MNGPSQPYLKARRGWDILRPAVGQFPGIGRAQWAEAFAFNAFLSLFPLMVLSVTIVSAITDRNRAEKQIIACVEGYVPIIFGACLCAAQAEERSAAAETSVAV